VVEITEQTGSEPIWWRWAASLREPAAQFPTQARSSIVPADPVKRTNAAPDVSFRGHSAIECRRSGISTSLPQHAISVSFLYWPRRGRRLEPVVVINWSRWSPSIRLNRSSSVRTGGRHQSVNALRTQVAGEPDHAEGPFGQAWGLVCGSPRHSAAMRDHGGVAQTDFNCTRPNGQASAEPLISVREKRRLTAVPLESSEDLRHARSGPR
jgi:hypothetical protein